MGGLISSALAGAAETGGIGAAKIGDEQAKAYDLQEHERLRSTLEGERQTALENLRSGHEGERQKADIASREKEGEAGRKSAEGIAASGRASAEKVAQMQRDLTLTITREGATPMIDDRGQVLMVGHDGKPKGYLMTPDGSERFKSPSLKAGAKEYAESISHQLADLGRAELNPQTMMDPEAMKVVTKRRAELTAQLSTVLSTGEVPKSAAPAPAPTINDPFKKPAGPAAGTPGAPAAPAISAPPAGPVDAGEGGIIDRARAGQAQREAEMRAEYEKGRSTQKKKSDDSRKEFEDNIKRTTIRSEM